MLAYRRPSIPQEYTTSDGTKASRLKQVDDKWIVARLERWGAQARRGLHYPTLSLRPSPSELTFLPFPPERAQDQLPMVGPKKGAILQDLIREYKPRRVLEARTAEIKREETAHHLPRRGARLTQRWKANACLHVALAQVGTFLGYSAILMAQAIQEGGKVVTLERDWKFVLSARRFLWQCNQARCQRVLVSHLPCVQADRRRPT